MAVFDEFVRFVLVELVIFEDVSCIGGGRLYIFI